MAHLLTNNTIYITLHSRCGRLTYYVPYPLSVIHANQPIIHTTLLSTYFDNPCGECTIEKKLHNTTSTMTEESQGRDETTSLPVVTPIIDTSTSQNVFNRQNQSDISNITKELSEDGLMVGSLETETIVIETEGSGSGLIETSGDHEPESEAVTDFTTEASVTVTRNTFDLFALSGPWKIFSFFLGERTLDKPASNSTILAEKPVLESVNVSSTTKLPLHHPKLCNGFDKSICVEFSTDKLLRARLCCLKEDINHDQGRLGFGCNRYTKPKCNKMLPLIKCCLKDFAQLLESYFQNNPPTQSQ